MPLSRPAISRLTAKRPKACLHCWPFFTRTDGGTAGNDIGQTSSLLHLQPLLALPTSTETRIVGNGLGQNSRPLRHRCSPTGLDLAATRARSLLAAAFKVPRFTNSSKLRALPAAALSTKELAWDREPVVHRSNAI